MIVVDTNIVAYLYLSGERSQQVEQLLVADPAWTAPALWRSEFRNVLAGYLRRRLLSLDAVMAMLHEADLLLGEREYELTDAAVMPLVVASECSAYDCEFVALARHLGVPLVTCDAPILHDFPDTATTPDRFLGQPSRQP